MSHEWLNTPALFAAPEPREIPHILDFVPSYMGVGTGAPGYACDNRYRDRRCVFQYTLSGAGLYRERRRTHTVGPGTGFLLTMPSDSHYFLGPHPTWDFLFVSFTGELARTYCRQILERNGPILRFEPDSRQAWPLCEILRLRSHSEHPPWTEISALLHLFVGRLIELTESSRSGADGRPVQRAVAYVREHFAEKSLNVERLADVAELTRSHFSCLFREQTGQAPAEYIREFRISLAQELLAGSRAPLKQVADQVGFGSVAHFCSIFKRYAGVSPGEFRRYQAFAGAKSHE